MFTTYINIIQYILKKINTFLQNNTYFFRIYQFSNSQYQYINHII